MSYVWIIRALWKIRDDVHDNAFPSFLDRDSVSFLFQYAKNQNELDDHCKKYHLHGFTTNIQDFTYLDKIHSEFLTRREDKSIEGLPPIMRIREKEQDTLLSEVNVFTFVIMISLMIRW
jgi:hypothetical protein